MFKTNTADIPEIVRMKPGALPRLGIYLKRKEFTGILFFYSDGLPDELLNSALESFTKNGIEVLDSYPVSNITYEQTQELFLNMNKKAAALVGLGGGKALDVAKYISFLSRKPFYSVPTSLSNDGFSSPNSSLTAQGKRKSLASAMPYAVIVDTEVCLKAPRALWLSGIGDMASKITAVQDWKMAFREKSTYVNDFSALLADATVHQVMAEPTFDLKGIKLLANALMLSGIAMAVCGSSRPASGSEHLISHALDQILKKPRLHGMQVGFATYLVSHFHEEGTEMIERLFKNTGFWDALQNDPFPKKELVQAIQMAPEIKTDYFTILSKQEVRKQLVSLLDSPSLSRFLC